MGYCMCVADIQFGILKQDQEATLKAIQGLHGSETIKDSSGKHFSWVDNNFHQIDDIHDMLTEWRWEPEYDYDGNITNLNFTGEKYGDDEVLFDAIAPFVQAGSFIEMRGEDGSVWRWVFDGNKCSKTRPSVQW